MSENRKESRIFHPLLIGAYAVLALLGHNIEEVRPDVAVRALLVSLAVSALLYAGLAVLLKNRGKAAVLTSWILILFFTYGHIYGSLKTSEVLGMTLGRHRLLAPLWLALLLLGALWIVRTRRNLSEFNRFMNWMSVLILVVPVYQIARFEVGTALAPQEAVAAQDAGLQLPEDGPPPDIYYIVLDAYSRDDTMRDHYKYDNTPFLEALEDMGFYVGRCSRSNYGQTLLSLTSSLNFTTIQDLGEPYTPGNESRVGLPALIRHSRTRAALENLGYEIVAFETGFSWTQIKDADRYLSPSLSMTSLKGAGGLNDFEVMLVETSAGSILVDAASKMPRFLQSSLEYPHQVHRERVLFVFDQLGKLAAEPGPKFVFAHIVSPHPPYVFGPNGEQVEQDKERRLAYRDQVEYINQVLLDLLPRMIQSSANPPIIILQGDHGGVEIDTRRRLNILNAYYLPDGGAEALYPTISPLNTFPMIFNLYFGGQEPLQPDDSYSSVYGDPYNFTQVKEARSNCNP